MTNDDVRKQRVAGELEEPVREARRLAERLGLRPNPVNYWIVDHDEMNALVAYDGFQTRYPHWRWGMKYDRQRKQRQYLGGKAFELVNNDNPAHAFLQESNSLTDQKAVITHVEAHADFFANSEWFPDDPDAARMLERHARAVREAMDDPEVGRETVEEFVDHVLTVQDNIDQHGPVDPDDPASPDLEGDPFEDLAVSDEVRRAVFGDGTEAEDGDPASFPATPRKDLLAFLRAHGKQYDRDAGKATEMTDWQRTVLDVLRRESHYFAPQRMTKVMNEGWACVAPDTPVFTADGLRPMREVVANRTAVSDGDHQRAVYDSNVIEGHDTVTIETRRGFELTGSNNHRIRRPDGSWVRLDELAPGDEIEVSGGNGLWPEEYVSLDWTPEDAVTLHDVTEEADVSAWTVTRFRETGRARRAEAIESAPRTCDGENQQVARRPPVTVPEHVDERFGRFLGLLVGDGHVSSASGVVGYTTADAEHAEAFAALASDLFDVDPTVEEQGSQWRVYLSSRRLTELLTTGLDLPDGTAAARKSVPDVVLRSPEPVVAEFLRGLFDADGYAGDQGVILSTSSSELSSLVQTLLTNFGILTRRRERRDGCFHVHATGRSARRFEDAIGFGFPEKRGSLRTYLEDLAWVEEETWDDEIVSVETGTGDVYDVSVEGTHRYAAAGLVNHNSYWESLMMGEEAFAGDDEFLEYADHQAQVLNSPGFNPYKLGKTLWEYIENTTNRRAVVERLLRVEGVTWRNFEDAVDLDAVQAALEPPPALQSVSSDGLDDLAALDPELVDGDALAAAREGDVDVDRYPWKVLTTAGLARRHYSLLKPQYRGFLADVNREELEQTARYLFDDTRYGSVTAALEDVDYEAGWKRMRSVRESHNDVTFIDEFLTQEFVDENGYFAYEFSHAAEENRVTSTDAADVKKKLLLQFTNLGKPTIAVYDANFRNRNELLLGHEYNGVALDLPQARATLERVFELWGRPVVLDTIRKSVDESDLEVARRDGEEPDPEEEGYRVRFDGESFESETLDWSEVEHLAADAVDYDTKPEDWLA